LTLPSGFERLLLGHAVAVARSDIAASVRQLLVSADGTRTTLHEYAARHPNARVLQGRGATYAVPLPHPHGGQRVVIRHNRHGGLFAPLSGDRFLSPTRAPHELDVSLALAKLGVPTPQLVAYALYPPGGVFQRADVCSLEIPDGRDLAQILLQEGAPERAVALIATAELVAALSRAGARHHDLNAKNVLVTFEAAYVLDVDRMTLGGTQDTALEGNLTRLVRSLRKWRDRFGAKISEKDIGELQANARQRMMRA
jgi:tRNA A-37 threonylcarbamoyl transferase component Bud32